MELLASHRKKKQGRFYQKVGGRGKKSRWQVTQGTLSNFFSIIGLLKKCICGTTNFFSPNCYPDQEENSGKSFKNTGQSRQLIIRPSLLYTQCLKIFPTTVDLITFRSGWLQYRLKTSFRKLLFNLFLSSYKCLSLPNAF